MFKRISILAAAAVLAIAAPAFATQKLATLNADSHPLDFGTTIVFDGAGMHAQGRPDNPNYRGATFPGLTAGAVTVSDVADNYALPSAPAVVPDSGRDLTEAEFVKLGMAINSTGINQTLVNMPVFGVLLRQYTNERGLKYRDAVTADGNALNQAIAAIVAAGYFTAAQRDAFLLAWRTTYPPGS